MRRLLFLLAAVPTLLHAQTPLAGHYRAAEGHELAAEIILAPDGRFEYQLAYGALDETASGHWRADGNRACLTTDPRPVPPEFVRQPPGDAAGPTVMVTMEGRGIAGIDFRIGFDSGDPVDGYTQYDGWQLPPEEHRIPRWIEVADPIHRFASPRFTLTPQDAGRLTVALVPHDLGVVDFEDACLEVAGQQAILHRKEGDMRFVRDD